MVPTWDRTEVSPMTAQGSARTSTGRPVGVRAEPPQQRQPPHWRAVSRPGPVRHGPGGRGGYPDAADAVESEQENEIAKLEAVRAFALPAGLFSDVAVKAVDPWSRIR